MRTGREEFFYRLISVSARTKACFRLTPIQVTLVDIVNKLRDVRIYPKQV